MSTHAWEELAPAEIEKRSFEILTQELGGRALDAENAPVIKRCIHTSADFDYADSLYFTPHAVRVLQDALRAGADIVTDTQMAQAGINKTRLARWGGQVHCFIADPDVAAEARRRGVTAGSVVELLWEAWLREQRFAAIRAAMASTSSADLVSYDAHGVDFDGALADGLVDAEPTTP